MTFILFNFIEDSVRALSNILYTGARLTVHLEEKQAHRITDPPPHFTMVIRSSTLLGTDSLWFDSFVPRYELFEFPITTECPSYA